ALTSALTVAGMVAAPLLGMLEGWVWALAFGCGFLLRAAAIRWEWGLPSYAGDSERG
ncbi:MAG: trimeric intracellular cation channel family protein, partial [Sphingomonadales bacterium]